MPVFVVERYLAGWGPAAVRALVDRVGGAGAAMARRGVRHVRSVVVAEDETCLCLFEGPDREAVRLANDEAGLPVDRIVTAEMLPDDAPISVASRRSVPCRLVPDERRIER